jgi:hypothetical protein
MSQVGGLKGMGHDEAEAILTAVKHSDELEIVYRENE